MKMKLTPPKKSTWWICVILGVVGVLASYVAIPVLSGIAFWLVVVGLALLAVACVVKGF